VAAKQPGDKLKVKISRNGAEQEVEVEFQGKRMHLRTDLRGVCHAVLKAAGMDYSDVVSVVVYLGDIKDFAQMNTIYKEYFKTEPLPTRSTVAVSGLARGAKLEITMTAVRTK
jgi:uncharacterized membrane protein